MGKVNQWLIDQGERPDVDWNKLPQQKQFITSTSPFVMFSGGFGTGKTSALNGKIVSLLTLIPGNLGLLARQDGKALRQTTLLDLLDKIPKEWIQSHDSQKGMLRLSQEVGGSILVYGDLKDLGDLKNHNLGFFAIDQTEETEWSSWEYLAGRLRRRNPIIDPATNKRQYWVRGLCPQSGRRHFAIGTDSQKCALCQEQLCPYSETIRNVDGDADWDLIIYPRYGFGVCNTEGPDHWIFQKFKGLPGQDEILSEGIEGYEAFHATTYEGMAAGFVDKDYVTNLESTYKGNQLMFDRYLMGKWVVAEGLVFPGFSRDIHVVHEDQPRYDGGPLLEEYLPVQEYIDPGITATTAVGWVVVEPCKCGCGKHNYWVIDEHYVASAVPEYHCDQIKQRREMIKRHVVSTEMDQQAFSMSNVQKVTASNESRLYSLSQLYIEQGIYVRRNQKDWDSGHARISAAIAPDPKHAHPVTGELGAPHLFVFSKCKWFCYEIFKYKWKKRKSDNHRQEEPVDRDDHHMDGFISFMSARPEFRVNEPPQIDTRSDFLKEIEDEFDELTVGAGSSYDFMEI